MDINYEGLKITPRAIDEAEKQDKNLDYFRIMIEVNRTREVPRMSEMYKIIYIGILGSGQELKYEEFLKDIEDKNMGIDKIYTIFNELISGKPKN